jgi:hydroxycarboxylate dehydrogenase B
MPSVRFQPDTLRTLAARVFGALGTPEDVASLVAGSLVEANLTGHDSHGVLRIPQYVQQVRAGFVKVEARPRVLGARGAAALVSGEWGFGQLAGLAAVDQAVRHAREYGVGVVGLVRCNHLGRLGELAERAASAGCAAMIWVGGLGPRAVPYGGSRPALGTNPMAFGFPVRGEHPAVLDFATTAVAAGKVMVARAARKAVPPGWIVDGQGRPATDPEEFFNGGALLPFGGHKGYCLSVFGELLGQALTGAEQLDDIAQAGNDHRHSGALVCAVDAGALRPADETSTAARGIVDRLRAVPPAPGVERVLTPGEPEARARRARVAAAIEVPEDTWGSIIAAAESAGLAPVDLPRPLPAS